MLECVRDLEQDGLRVVLVLNPVSYGIYRTSMTHAVLVVHAKEGYDELGLQPEVYFQRVCINKQGFLSLSVMAAKNNYLLLSNGRDEWVRPVKELGHLDGAPLVRVVFVLFFMQLTQVDFLDQVRLARVAVSCFTRQDKG